MNIDNQGEHSQTVSESETEDGLTPQKKELTQWHRIFGTEQELALTSVAIEVYPELDLMSKPPKADLLLLRNQHPVWTDEQRARLPDGIRDTTANHILIEFKYTESANIRALRQAISYDHIYMEAKLRANPEFEGQPEKALSTFLLSSMSPSKKTLTGLGFEPTDKKGVYRCDDPIKGRITILSLNDLAREPHNALVKCFASKPKEQEAAFAMLRETGMMLISPELLWLLEGLEVTLVEKGGLKMPETATSEITAEYLMDIGKTIYERNLPLLPVEMLLSYVPAERILSHLKPEERIAGLHPAEILGGFKPEERVAGLQPEDLQQIPIVRQTVTESRQMGSVLGQQRTLLRSLQRQFVDVPDEIAERIEETFDSDQLDEWMDQLFDAQTLEDINFGIAV